MKKYLKYILVGILALPCIDCSSPEPKEFEFESIITNYSSEEFTISLYNNTLLIREETLTPNESASCLYPSEFFDGFRGCLNSSTKGIDSITIIFLNGKGFICIDKPMAIQTLCFNDNQRDLFFKSDAFKNLSNNRYEFVITEEDFNNAHELPE